MPAIVALIKFESVAATTTRKPKRATSPRNCGATLPNEPAKIAIEVMLANPHNANERIACVRASSTVLPAAITAASGCK